MARGGASLHTALSVDYRRSLFRNLAIYIIHRAAQIYLWLERFYSCRQVAIAISSVGIWTVDKEDYYDR